MDFADEVVPLLRAEVAALHRGDLAPRLALWSRHDPVTLFGAHYTARGWAELEPVFDRLAAMFGGSDGLEMEAVAAGASDGLGYVVAIERSTTVLDGQQATYALRVTTVLRHEDGAWKVVHRHADPLDAASAPPTRS
jgi:ketosteroid isomerase-like protein